MGLPLGPVLIEVLHRNFNATPGGDWMMACHAVRLLASAPKDRTSSEHADWVATKVALGQALVEVPDYAHCVHTRAGQELGRGLMQWWDYGAQVRDELSGSPVPRGADRDPPPRRSGERDCASSVPLGKRHRGSRLRLSLTRPQVPLRKHPGLAATGLRRCWCHGMTITG